MPKDGGTPAAVEVPGLTDGRFYYPEFLPDGTNILFAWAAGNDELGFYLATMEKGKLTRGPFLLCKNMTAGHYSPTGGGRLLYVQDDKLYARKLNIRQGTLEGEPELVVNGVVTALGSRRGAFSVSRNGVLVWKAGRAALAQLTWFDRKGKILSTAGPPCLPDVLLSPDEKQVLAHTVTDHMGFSIVEANHSGSVSLPPRIITSVWMPDSAHILYSRREGGSHLILERAVEGGDERELAWVPELNKLLDISADRTALIFKWQKSLLCSPPRRAGGQAANDSGNSKRQTFARRPLGGLLRRAWTATISRCTRSRFLPEGCAHSLLPPAGSAQSGAPMARRLST